MQFGFETNGADVVEHFASEVRGRVFLITGTSAGGIGGETAVSLAHGSPALLVLLGRSPAKSQPVIEAISAVDAAVPVKFVEADLASLASVRRAADRILADPEIPRIDVLINNAAIMFSPFGLTADGIEQQLATGHVGHFLLTNLLAPKLLQSTDSSGGKAPVRAVRVVNVSSSGNKLGPIRWTDPNFSEKDAYTPLLGYGQAKRANVLFTVALNARLGHRADLDFRSFALHPGSISTGLQTWLTPELIRDASKVILDNETAHYPVKTLQQGCSTTVRAALDPSLKPENGVFLSDCQVTTNPGDLSPDSVNPGDAEKLWPWSEKLVGQEFRY